MLNEIDNTADIIDVRDIIARVEELEAELTDAHEGQASNNGEFEAWLKAMADNDAGTLQDAALDLILFRDLLTELAGNGGDEDWRGDWYPVTLIRDSYFEEAMDELLEDIGDLPRDLPGYLKITVDYEALQMDYTSVEFDGVTYWYR